MNPIKFKSTFKASGKKYEQIVFWNRFLRNKTELIISIFPAIVSIALVVMGYRSTFAVIIYCICIAYPFIAYHQFKSAVAYHLKNRDAIEGAVCEFTLMDSGILCEFDDYEDKKVYKWDDFTTVYNKLGYYMFFEKGNMHVMLNQEDIPAQLTKPVYEYIDAHIDHNKCIIK